MENPERLIGRKVRGFKFEYASVLFKSYMSAYIGKEGIVEEKAILTNSFLVAFEDGSKFYYPADQIESHLVEDEIPTLSDGVMMLVSFNNIDWFERKVLGKKNNSFYCWNEEYKNLIQVWDYAKEITIEPTKEEQLTAILGSDEKVSEIMELFKNYRYEIN